MEGTGYPVTFLGSFIFVKVYRLIIPQTVRGFSYRPTFHKAVFASICAGVLHFAICSEERFRLQYADQTQSAQHDDLQL